MEVLEKKRTPQLPASLANTLVQRLSREVYLYEQLLEQERLKSDAIVNKDASMLESLCKVQAGLLDERELHEKERFRLTEEAAYLLNIPVPESLGELLTLNFAQEYKTRLNELGNRLKDCITRLSSKVETNHKMLQDNHELFKNLLGSVSKEPVDDYIYDADSSKKVKDKKTVRPILLDMNC